MSGNIVMREADGIVVLCTANVCRSPMAAALLARRLSEFGVTARVRSAGMLRDGDPPLPEVVSVMAGYGIDITAHRSRLVGAADLARAEPGAGDGPGPPPLRRGDRARGVAACVHPPGTHPAGRADRAPAAR